MQITLDIDEQTITALDILAGMQGENREALIQKALAIFVMEEHRSEALAWKDGEAEALLRWTTEVSKV